MSDRPPRRPGRGGKKRAGNVVVLVAVLMPVLVGMVAVSADVAVVGVTRAQLQTASDAASLASAKKLLTATRLQVGDITTTDLTSAHDAAIAMAGYNKAMTKPVVLLPNASNTNAGTEDIVLGYLARPYDTSSVLQTDVSKIPYYNAVQIR